MRPVRQSQAAECGLACLAMIACHHGHGTDLRALRQRFPLSLKGATLARLVDIAQALGFQSRALRLELGELGQLGLPCILHWDLNHFVVLEKAGKRRVRVCDPAVGARTLALEEVSRHFTGVALELVPGAGFEARTRPAPVPLSALAGRVQGLWPALAQLLLLSVALQVFVVLAPFFMQWVVDQALVSADRQLLTVLGRQTGDLGIETEHDTNAGRQLLAVDVFGMLAEILLQQRTACLLQSQGSGPITLSRLLEQRMGHFQQAVPGQPLRRGRFRKGDHLGMGQHDLSPPRPRPGRPTAPARRHAGAWESRPSPP